MQNNLITQDKYGTLHVDFTRGVTAEGCEQLLGALTNRSRENLRKQGIEIIEETPAIDFDRYSQIPGAVVHDDGVIELPVTSYESVAGYLGHMINTEPDPWFLKNYCDTAAFLDQYEEYDFGQRLGKITPELIKDIIRDRYEDDHCSDDFDTAEDCDD